MNGFVEYQCLIFGMFFEMSSVVQAHSFVRRICNKQSQYEMKRL